MYKGEDDDWAEQYEAKEQIQDDRFRSPHR